MESPTNPNSSEEFPINIEEALERFGDDRDFLKEMIQEFLDYIPGQLEAIRKAIADQSPETLQTEGHSVKGAAANLAAEPVRRLAYQIEMIGREGKTDGAENALTDLTTELDRLRQFAETI